MLFVQNKLPGSTLKLRTLWDCKVRLLGKKNNLLSLRCWWKFSFSAKGHETISTSFSILIIVTIIWEAENAPADDLPGLLPASRRGTLEKSQVLPFTRNITQAADGKSTLVGPQFAGLGAQRSGPAGSGASGLLLPTKLRPLGWNL